MITIRSSGTDGHTGTDVGADIHLLILFIMMFLSYNLFYHYYIFYNLFYHVRTKLHAETPLTSDVKRRHIVQALGEFGDLVLCEHLLLLLDPRQNPPELAPA